MDGAVVFLGTNSVPELTHQLLSVLAGLRQPSSNTLLFFEDDPSLNDPTTQALLSYHTVEIISGSIQEFCNAVAQYTPASKVVSKDSKPVMAKKFSQVIEQYGAYIKIVPGQLVDSFNPGDHRTALVDGLFRPASLDWRPFLAKWDLRRTASDEIIRAIDDSILNASTNPKVPQIIAIRGEAGVGKTTMLKRVAIESSIKGLGAVWIPRSYAGGMLQNMRKLATGLNELRKSNESCPPLIIFCDDPWYLHIDVEALVNCFSNLSVPVVFVFSFRNSDYFTAEGIGSSLPADPDFEIETPTDIDLDEIERLPEMLMTIGAAADLEDARGIVMREKSRSAEDLLCSLWYLVPESREQLAESLRDEYRRLGALADSVGSIATEAARTSDVAKHAYEAVTVTSHLKVELPLEVLVRSLGINYDDWLDISASGRPLWGLLYSAEAANGDTITYHTRNHVVTRILLDLVNGGVGHAGEVRVLKSLISACDVGTPIYRNFIVDLLVRHRSHLEKSLNEEDGLELFRLAASVLPTEDRLLEHHMGVWMNHCGSNRQAAYKQLEHALNVEVYPGSDRDAPREHIHTSMAATVVQLVKDGIQTPDTGLQLVKDHLRQASGPQFFSAHSAHVAANTLFEFAQLNAADPDESTRLDSYAEALQEVEIALQSIGHRRDYQKGKDKSIELLTTLQRKILASIPDTAELREFADKKFKEEKSQLGFEVLARKLMSEASVTNKGSDFNDAKIAIDSYIDRVRAVGVEPSPELIAVRTDLVIRWRVQKSLSLDWRALRIDLEIVLGSSRYREDVMKTFYMAVSLFHIVEIPTANAVFAQIRRMRPAALRPREIRCFLSGKEGHPKRMQCTTHKQNMRQYASISELGTDVLLSSTAREFGVGGISHVYVGFALNGPIAVSERPDPGEFELPRGYAI
jgi:hypothetical protein